MGSLEDNGLLERDTGGEDAAVVRLTPDELSGGW